MFSQMLTTATRKPFYNAFRNVFLFDSWTKSENQRQQTPAWSNELFHL